MPPFYFISLLIHLPFTSPRFHLHFNFYLHFNFQAHLSRFPSAIFSPEYAPLICADFVTNLPHAL